MDWLTALSSLMISLFGTMLLVYASQSMQLKDSYEQQDKNSAVISQFEAAKGAMESQLHTQNQELTQKVTLLEEQNLQLKTELEQTNSSLNTLTQQAAVMQAAPEPKVVRCPRPAEIEKQITNLQNDSLKTNDRLLQMERKVAEQEQLLQQKDQLVKALEFKLKNVSHDM